MAEVSLALLKKQCKADDFSDDDAYLQHLLDTAEAHIIRTSHRTLAELTEIGGGTFPLELQHAELMLASHWYNQRESVSATQMHQVPDSLDALVKPYRKLADSTEDD